MNEVVTEAGLFVMLNARRLSCLHCNWKGTTLIGVGTHLASTLFLLRVSCRGNIQSRNYQEAYTTRTGTQPITQEFVIGRSIHMIGVDICVRTIEPQNHLLRYMAHHKDSVHGLITNLKACCSIAS